jgi:flagellar biogenesis protein FliO
MECRQPISERKERGMYIGGGLLALIVIILLLVWLF